MCRLLEQIMEPDKMSEDEMELSGMGADAAVEWRTWPGERVAVGQGLAHLRILGLSEEGKLVTQTADEQYSLTTTGEELQEGRHYWEIEVLGDKVHNLLLGVCRSNADLRVMHGLPNDRSCWLMHADDGSLFGNGKLASDGADYFEHGDRMVFLLDLDDGSLCFFKNGFKHGPGYPAGSVSGPVARAAHMYVHGSSVRLLPDAEWPVGYSKDAQR